MTVAAAAVQSKGVLAVTLLVMFVTLLPMMLLTLPQAAVVAAGVTADTAATTDRQKQRLLAPSIDCSACTAHPHIHPIATVAPATA